MLCRRRAECSAAGFQRFEVHQRTPAVSENVVVALTPLETPQVLLSTRCHRRISTSPTCCCNLNFALPPQSVHPLLHK